jgi:hypothetical protein
LLTRAVADGGANETAHVFLQRLGRLQPPAAERGAIPGRHPLLEPSAAPHRTARGAAAPALRTNWFATVVASAIVATAIVLAAQPIASWLGDRPIAAPPVSARPDEPLPTLRQSELQIARAAELHAAGRLHDALRLLDGIDRADPLRAEADRVTAAVQRDLLATTGPPASEAR